MSPPTEYFTQDRRSFMRSSPFITCGVIAAAAALGMPINSSQAQPVNPVYTTTVVDSTTGDNEFIFGSFRYWDVDAGSDSYQTDLYERPTAQGFQPVNGRYAVNEYLAYIDIERAQFGFDERFMYVQIDVVGRDKRTQDGVNTIEGLQGRYGVRFGANPDGRNSIYLIADQPESASIPNTAWTLAKTEGFRDTDMDVGGRGGPIHGQPGPSGLSVTKVDNLLEEYGLNGYDEQFIQTDGLLLNGQIPVLWQRVNPMDNTVVELALDYVAAGLSRADLEAITYLHFEAQTGDLADPQLGLWNDKFTGIEAGSPNPGIGTDNEFGTQGLGSINGVDTVRAGTITPPPPPPELGACCVGQVCTLVVAADCGAVGGIFAGVGTACESATCCAADFDGNGVLAIADVFAYLGAFFAGDLSADRDGNGVVEITDIFQYLIEYFAGC